MNSKKSFFENDVHEQREIFIARCEQINEQLPSEETCVDALFKMINAARPVQCTRCFSTKIVRQLGERRVKCADCGKKINFTVGTGFEGKKRIRERFAAIMLKEEGLFFSKLQFSKNFKISYSTAWQIIIELDLLLASALKNEYSAFEIESQLFESCIGKRSLETPAREHPWAEQKILEEEQEQFSDTTKNPNAANSHKIPNPSSMSAFEKKVFFALKKGPILFDNLLDVTGLPIGKLSEILLLFELDGIVERLAGDRYALATQRPRYSRKSSSKSSLDVDSSNRLSKKARKRLNDVAYMLFRISQTMQGVSRKFIQAYVASYWCSIDRCRWATGSLLSSCILSRSRTIADMRAFVSPLLLKAKFR